MCEEQFPKGVNLPFSDQQCDHIYEWCKNQHSFRRQIHNASAQTKNFFSFENPAFFSQKVLRDFLVILKKVSKVIKTFKRLLFLAVRLLKAILKYFFGQKHREMCLFVTAGFKCLAAFVRSGVSARSVSKGCTWCKLLLTLAFSSAGGMQQTNVLMRCDEILSFCLEPFTVVTAWKTR